MLVYVRPSNEALLRARVPGAQDQRGCPSHLFIVGALRARMAPGRSPSHPRARAKPRMWGARLELVWFVEFQPHRAVKPNSSMVLIAFSVCTSYMIGVEPVSSYGRLREENG